MQSFFATNVGKNNALKIVPLITFSDVIEQCKKLENVISGTIFNALFLPTLVAKKDCIK